MSKAPKFVIEDHMPKDPLMQIAWSDCLLWASSDPAVLKEYRDGGGLMLATNPLGKAIDLATGFDGAVAECFVTWFNNNLWGRNAAGLPIDAGDPEPEVIHAGPAPAGRQST